MGRRMTLMPLLLLTLVVMCAPMAVVAYSTGATSESCYEMQVFHSDSFSGIPASSVDCGASVCQYNLSLVSIVASETNRTRVNGDSTTYQCGRVYELLLISSQNPFEGFLVEARNSTASGDFDPTSTIWGEWIYNGSDPYHGVVCNRSSTDSSEGGFLSAATQNAASENTNVTLYWKAPQANTFDEFQALPENLTFWVTIVEEQLTFFLPIKGPVLVRDCVEPQVVPVVELTATPQPKIALGQNVSLFCNVIKAAPNLNFTYVWRLNGGPALSETTNSLILTDVMANQFGNYSCDVTNAAGTGSGNIVVVEGVLPEVMIVQPAPLVIGTNIILICDASGDEPITFMWERIGQQQGPGMFLSNNETLALIGISGSQYGMYRCTANNTVGSDSDVVDIIQAIHVSITASPESINTTSPNPIILTCSTHSVPTPIFIWIKLDNETETELATTDTELAVTVGSRVTIQVDLMGKNSTCTLLIEPSEPADSGSYFCRAVNTIAFSIANSAEAEVVVYESCPPDVSGGIFWQRTRKEEAVNEPCSKAGPFYRDGPFATRQCNERGEWDEADFTGCTLTNTVSDPFLLLWLVIEAEEMEDEAFLLEEMTAILTERSVSFTSVTLLSVYIASISLTFEVKLNSSTDYTSGVSEFMEYFNDESFQLGEYNVFEGSRGLLGIVPSETCQCASQESSLFIQLCNGATISPCACTEGQCMCQDPFVGDGSTCTMDNDGDGYPDVPLESCVEGSGETYCMEDTCPDVSNPDQNPEACQVNVTVEGCPYGPDSEWNITWANTERGENDTQRCPGGVDTLGMASRLCGDDGDWVDPPDVLECQSIELLSIEAETLILMELVESSSLSSEEIANSSSEIVERLIEATGPEPQSLLPLDLNSTNVVISILLDVSQESNFTVDRDIVDIFDNVLNETNFNGWNQLQMIGTGSQALLDNTERYGLLLATSLSTTDPPLRRSRGNIAIQANQYEQGSNASLEFPQSEDLVNFTQQGEQEMSPARIEIPREVVEERLGEASSVPLVFILFRNIEDFLPSSSQGLENSRGASVVISATVGTEANQAGTPISTGTPINLSFSVEMVEDAVEYVCVYWNFSQPVGGGSWTSVGVETTNVTTDGDTITVQCESTHLTSFAVLVDVAGGTEDISEEEGRALQIISYLGCSISVVSLIITVGFFLFKGKGLLSAVHHFVHLNLALALLLGYLLFLAGIETATACTIGCTVVAALLQYFFLSAFCWMLCEGIMLYLMLVVVFSTLSKKWWPFMLLGWVTPVPIVAVGVGIRHDYYGVKVNGELEFCWLSTEKGTIWGFVGPMLVIIMINVVFLGFALRALWRTKKGQKARKMEDGSDVLELAKALLLATLILLPLLGLTWVFGILTLDANTTVFAWLFTIFNSLQGLGIVFFHVIRSDQVWGRIRLALSACYRKSAQKKTTRGASVTSTAHTSSSVLKSTLRPWNNSTSIGMSASSIKSGKHSIPGPPTKDEDLKLDLSFFITPLAEEAEDEMQLYADCTDP